MTKIARREFELSLYYTTILKWNHLHVKPEMVEFRATWYNLEI